MTVSADRATVLPPRAGVGLKPEHYDTILDARPDIGFFEVHAENYMGAGGPQHAMLRALRDRYALSIHGVGLSIGSAAPLDTDHLDLVNAFPPDAPVGYWHDTGHADIKEAMGLLQHREHLEKLAPRTLGFHLHDVNSRVQDHQAIGAGRIDFKMVSGFWRPEHLLTIELSPRVSVDDVRASKRRVEALLG